MSHPDSILTALTGQAGIQLRGTHRGHGSKPDASPGESSCSSSSSAARNAIHGPYIGCTVTPRMLGPAMPATLPSSMKLSVRALLIKGYTVVHRAPDARIGAAMSRSTTLRVKSSSGFSRSHHPGLRAAWDLSAIHSAPPPLPITTIVRASGSIAEAREISLTEAS